MFDYDVTSQFHFFFSEFVDEVRRQTLQNSGEEDYLDSGDDFEKIQYTDDDVFHWFNVEQTADFPVSSQETVADKPIEEPPVSDEDFIYKGSSMRVGSFMLLFTVFAINTSLTGDAISQLLSLFLLALPQGSKICSSLSVFKRYVQKMKTP